MTGDPYRRLAQRIDKIPNGFPPTDSGVELKLLAKMFTSEEADLASLMKLRPEPAAVIAKRADAKVETALEHLEAMAAKGLISVSKQEDELAFSLQPFVVGFYEAWLPRMDEEFASLFEQYLNESEGALLRTGPSLHRVLPVHLPIETEIEIFPYESATSMLDSAKSWGVRDCICRVQKTLIGEACGHPIENCLVFAPTAHAFESAEDVRVLSKEEAFAVLEDAEQAGLVHSSGNYRTGNSYICNCCTCSCGVMRGISELGIRTAVARSAFRVVVDVKKCMGCGSCIDRCQFGALSLVDGVAEVDPERCTGCGLCTTRCPSEALVLTRLPEEDISKPPATIRHWMRDKANARGISLEEIT